MAFLLWGLNTTPEPHCMNTKTSRMPILSRLSFFFSEILFTPHWDLIVWTLFSTWQYFLGKPQIALNLQKLSWEKTIGLFLGLLEKPAGLHFLFHSCLQATSAFLPYITKSSNLCGQPCPLAVNHVIAFSTLNLEKYLNSVGQ